MTHTLIPLDEHYKIIRGFAWSGIPVKFISDDEMIDEHGRVYVCWRDGVIKRKGV